MKKPYLIGVVGLGLLCGCGANNTQTFNRLMQQENITNATNLGTAWFGCAESDNTMYNVKFKGVKNNTPVSGVICGGPLKGYTIRYN
jgi:hypothetical protein